MRHKIQDEFTNLDISKQQKYQLRQLKNHKCIVCGKPAVSKRWCLEHTIANRERQRTKTSSQKRYESLSYKIQDQNEKKERLAKNGFIIK